MRVAVFLTKDFYASVSQMKCEPFSREAVFSKIHVATSVEGGKTILDNHEILEVYLIRHYKEVYFLCACRKQRLWGFRCEPRASVAWNSLNYGKVPAFVVRYQHKHLILKVSNRLIISVDFVYISGKIDSVNKFVIKI